MVSVPETVIVATAEVLDTQPAAEVPDTVYDVVEDGETTGEPLEYVYVLAPVGLNVNELPGQIAPPATAITGIGLTVMFETAVGLDTQPVASVPATVYELVVVGITTALPPWNV